MVTKRNFALTKWKDKHVIINLCSNFFPPQKMVSKKCHSILGAFGLSIANPRCNPGIYNPFFNLKSEKGLAFQDYIELRKWGQRQGATQAHTFPPTRRPRSQPPWKPRPSTLWRACIPQCPHMSTGWPYSWKKKKCVTLLQPNPKQTAGVNL